MKKFFVLLIATILILSLVSCDNGGGEETADVSEDIKRAVSSRVSAVISLQYDTAGTPSVTYYINEIEDNVYEVTGKVTVRDKYGDSYTGNYDAIVERDSDTGNCSVTSFDLGTLYKN